MICPDYSEAPSSPTCGCIRKQGTDAALAMAMGHVILKEFYFDRQVPYFDDYARRYTDMPMLVRLVKQDGRLRARAPAARFRLRRRSSGETNNPEWKTVAYDEATGELVAPHGSVGFRWGEKGKWNLEAKDAPAAQDVDAAGCRC